jgi:hypothetical protein
VTSSSLSSRERIKKRTPSGASKENPAPRPSTTSTVRCVCFQYSYWSAPIQNGVSSPTCPSRMRELAAFTRQDWSPLAKSFLDVLQEQPWHGRPHNATTIP